jgi:hypothetical protein
MEVNPYKYLTSVDDYMSIYYKHIDKELLKMDPLIDTNKFLSTLLEIYLNWPNSTDIVLITDVPMDLYFLSRLFIKFDEKKMNRGPVGCRDPQYTEIKNAIVCGGSIHTDIYEKFLMSYFKKEPDIYIYIYIYKEYADKYIEFDQPFDFFS